MPERLADIRLFNEELWLKMKMEVAGTGVVNLLEVNRLDTFEFFSLYEQSQEKRKQEATEQKKKMKRNGL